MNEVAVQQAGVGSTVTTIVVVLVGLAWLVYVVRKSPKPGPNDPPRYGGTPYTPPEDDGKDRQK